MPAAVPPLAPAGGGEAPPRQRKPASKVDFVKVRLWLANPDENNLAHAVVLSRYLVARNLTATLVPQHEAVKIALETKKALVERELLDISYADFERVLMECATKRGYGNAQTRAWHRCLALFHAVRVPLVVVVTGTAASGKSQLSRALSQRLNLTNVVPVDMMRELAPRTDGDAFAWDAPNIVDAHARECQHARKCVTHEVVRCVADGKPLVLEGLFIAPELYTPAELVGVAATDGARQASPPHNASAGAAGVASDKERARWTAHWTSHAPLVLTLCVHAEEEEVRTRLPLWLQLHAAAGAPAPERTDVACANLIAVQDALISATQRLPATPGAAHALVTSRNGFVDDDDVDRAHKLLLDLIAGTS